MGCISIENKEMIDVVVAVLTGNTDKMRSLIQANDYSPIKLARWSGERRGVSDEGDIDSYQLSYAMFDALKQNELFDKLNVGKMWKLHQELFPNINRTCYDQFGFIIWNWMDEPWDNPYFDENDRILYQQKRTPHICPLFSEERLCAATESSPRESRQFIIYIFDFYTAFLQFLAYGIFERNIRYIGVIVNGQSVGCQRLRFVFADGDFVPRF